MGMNSEKRICQNCKGGFEIDAQDLAFYEKMKVPPPTFCSECRAIRRLLWLNSRSLFKRPCQAPGHNEMLVAKYHPNAERVVYDKDFWWSDKWDPMNYGRDYDFTKPFFVQFNELMKRVPVRDLNTVNSVNCEYCQSAVESKDCYMSVGGYRAERCFYCDSPIASKDCFDSYMAIGCDSLYESFNCNRSYNLVSCSYCDDCMDSRFLFNCRNCSNCFGCVNLRSKQYHIFNQPYSKEEYQAKMKDFGIGKYQSFVDFKNRFEEFKLKFPRKFAFIVKTENVVGDVIENAKNCYYCFEVKDGAENCKYLITGGLNLKDSYDVVAGGGKSESLYEVISTGPNCQNVLFSSRIQESFDVRYSAECYTNSHLFGCVSLRNKEYCILNKQYAKEEYEKLVSKIVEHMNQMPHVDGRGMVYGYGEFFPFENSPFAYNQSDAQEFFDFPKEEAIKRGYRWEEEVGGQNYRITIQAADLPEDIKDIPDSIVDEVIGCGHRGQCGERCPTAFRIVSQELAFYRKFNLPLPRLCPNCRMFQRLKQRNPVKLWHRQCQCIGGASENGVYKNTIAHAHGDDHCPNEFETSYAPDRPEIVYCEQCYQAEVV